MTDERFKDIWTAICVNAFYMAGEGRGVGEGSDITHDEMIELMQMAKSDRQKET